MNMVKKHILATKVKCKRAESFDMKLITNNKQYGRLKVWRNEIPTSI